MLSVIRMPSLADLWDWSILTTDWRLQHFGIGRDLLSDMILNHDTGDCDGFEDT